MALLDKWQTILLTSWKWQLLVGTSFGGLLLLIVGIWLLLAAALICLAQPSLARLI